MGSFFVKIYDFFNGRKIWLWLTLIVTTISMILSAVNVKYVEDITNFFPKQESDLSLIFSNLKAKDKFVVMFSSNSDKNEVDSLILCAEQFSEEINSIEDFTNSAVLKLGVNDSIIESTIAFIYDNLPLFLDQDNYAILDSLTTPETIAQTMKSNYTNLLSPIGGYISDIVYRDPLGLGSNPLKELQNQGNNFQYKIIDSYIFSKDEKTLLCYIEPTTNNGSGIVDIIESSLQTIQNHHPNIVVEYFGAPAVAAYNARQIKMDSMITLNIAILIVVIFITIAFRNKYSTLLVLTPVVYGALFALSMIYFIKGEISIIAIGSGTIIFGVALSYSIHILSHTNHCKDIRSLISELAYPLTIGSFTTIGAFAGLLFTDSTLLQDFGLFSSLTLIGTTLFALIFLPHFLKIKSDNRPDSKLLKFMTRLSNIQLDRKKPLVLTIIVLTIICSLFFRSVEFDSNMMNLNFDPPHLKSAEKRLNSFMDNRNGESNILFIASSNKTSEAAAKYGRLCLVLDSLHKVGKISSYSSIDRFVLPDSLQQTKIEQWNQFWTPQKQSQAIEAINTEAYKLGFDTDAFMGFERMISKSYTNLSYDNNSLANQLFTDWISQGKSLTLFIAQVRLPASTKSEIYDIISTESGMIAVDRAFFASKMAEDVKHNFYVILYICGFLIFFALLLSYGRLELTLISFLPMFISWILILGIMSLLGIEFNIVTIILSTFIFGIGDDFSIFIMDGLQSEYSNKSKVLTHHKTAISFSAFVIVVGIGALVFAQHPAMRSLGVISLIGIVVVVVVAYTIQPLIFRLLISSQTKNGGFPYTILGLFNTAYAFGLFTLGCFVIQFIIIVLHAIPIGSKRRKECVHRITNLATCAFLRAMVTTKKISINDSGETFEKPAIIISNHQSFIDILLLLSLHPKFVMVTNQWVWNSPFFGKIVRYLDFYHTQNGYEELAETLQDKVNQGYSVIVFPEGTRSSDNNIKRFHKGAFYLSEKLKLDIIPILMYGNGLISSKHQPLYIKNGEVLSKILKRIPFDSAEYGIGYKERSKSITRYFKQEYDNLYEERNRVSNPYFKDAIIKNYIYKGPVLEWYMRIKLRMEGWYDQYDRLLPRHGYIVDLGCGYGAMSYMLSMLSNKRRITGVDYDCKKIVLANNCFAKNNNIEFIQCDIRKYKIPQADAYVISDVLHYLNPESQRMVIESCISRLNRGGKIIIRDGDTSQNKKHSRTERTEKWSTKIVKFNKVDGELCFFSKETLTEIAHSNSMNIAIVESDSRTSNTLFVLTQKEI